jgi:hypothetical protein
MYDFFFKKKKVFPKEKRKNYGRVFSDTIINLNYQHKVINLSNDNSTLRILNNVTHYTIISFLLFGRI